MVFFAVLKAIEEVRILRYVICFELVHQRGS